MNKLITKIVGVVLGLTMATGVGVAVANSNRGMNKVEAINSITNTITFGGGSSIGSYTSSFSETDSASKSWTIGNFNNNSWKWSSSVSGASKTIKCGRKDNASVGYIQNESAFSNTTFTKVDLYISALTSGKLNNIKVYGGASSGSETTTLATVTSVAASTSTPTSITLSNQSNYSYYKISFDMASGSSNGLLSLDKVCFYQDVSTYSVTYDANATTNIGGTTPSPHTGLSDGATQNLSASGPTRWGYTFGGWSTTQNGTTPVSSVTINGDNVTVYAIWTADLTVTGAHASVPFTVAQARNHIDAGVNLQENYVSGKISQIDSYNSTYHSLQYWISDDGTTTNQLEVYSGKGLNGADFSSTSDIATGATVVVCGTLKKYSSTYEFDKENYQVSYTAPVITVTHDVTFVSNGGSNSPEAMEVGDNLTFVFPSAGTKTNYIFKGWSTDGSAPFYQEGNTSNAVTADATYNAYWQTEGTSADPYSVTEANAAIAANTGLVGAYTTGTISQVDSFDDTSKGITYHISDDGTTTNQLKIYKGKGVSGADFSEKDDIETGATVTITGNLKNYNSTYEYDSGNYQTSYTAPVAITLSSISISGSMTKTTYTTAESWSPTGLTVTATYSDSSTSDVTSSVEWTYSPATPTAMGAGSGQTLTVTATYSGETDSTTATVTVTTVSYTNTSGLVPDTYFIKYGSNYFNGTITSGKGSSSTTKPESTDAQFTFSLVGNDTWTVVNGSSQYLTIGSTSTSLGYSNSLSTLEVESGNSSGTYKIKGSSGRYVAWYESSSEFRTYTSGSLDMTLESVNAATYTISYSANGGTGDAMPNTTGTAPAVASCSFTAPEGYTFSRWNTASDGSGDDYAPGDIAASNLTLYAIWIVEIGQNITMAPGTSASNVSVVTTTSKTKDAIKCGTSKAAGDMTLTLKNSGMTKIKVYVAGWSTDSTNQTIDVSISSGTISPASITFTCDSGISGNGSTYTLDANESTYRFDFTLTNAPADAVITLAAHTAKDNRFVVWGATDMFAESFANDFLTNLSCTANGSSQPTYTNDYSWSEFSALYSSLDDEEQAILTNATANQSGTAIQQAVARYDYIVGKYNKGLGITSYTDFMHRDPSAIGVSARVILSGINVNSSAISVVVIVMSMVSLTAVGGYFFLRKKKEEK